MTSILFVNGPEDAVWITVDGLNQNSVFLLWEDHWFVRYFVYHKSLSAPFLLSIVSDRDGCLDLDKSFVLVFLNWGIIGMNFQLWVCL